jgi:hypothetical protein
LTKIYSVFLLIFCLIQFAVAQSILVMGKIFDQDSRLPITHATIKCGNFGTSSQNDGSFRLVLNQDIVNKLGLSISCIGYESKTIKYTDNIQIDLKPSKFQLNEVIVGINGLSILEKAIDRIEINYPQKDFTMKGYIKMHQMAKDDTTNYKFFKNEAIIKKGITPYKKNTSDSKVTLIQNRNQLTDSLKKEKSYVRFVSAYLLPTADIVHRRSYILDKSNLKKYEYYVSSMTSINGRRTYVITFNSIKKQDNEGVIYIDSASYAIVRFNSTMYNLKPSFSIPINQASLSYNYQKIKNKWYSQNVSYNGNSFYNSINYTRFEEYHTISIDFNKLDINYNEIIQSRTEDLQVNNVVSKEKWTNYQFFIDSLKRANLISEIEVPKVDPDYREEKESFKSKLINGLRTYIVSGGYRTTLKFNRSYLNVVGSQPLLNKNFTQVSNYNLSAAIQFRLYNNLFIETNGGFNYGIGGLRINQNDYLLAYNFVFNKTHHPLTIAPSFGYSNIELGKKKEQFYYQESLIYKMSFIYEKKRKTSYVLSLTYVDPFYVRNTGLILNNLKFTPGIGIMRRF